QAVYSSVNVASGRVTDVSVQLKLGSSTQTVEVSAAPAQLQTSTNEVGTTIDNKDIQDLPYASLDTLSFATLMAGAQSGSGGEAFNNLPNASMAITLDGMDNNSERFKSGGTSFYAFAPERIGATEEATVSTTGEGSDVSGGDMSIRFTTKRGTDQYHFQVNEQMANEDLNANSFFNNLRGQARPRSRQNNVSFGIGGPLIPFSKTWSRKLFFYAYFEAQPQPGSFVDTNTVLSKDAEAGIFDYVDKNGVSQKVNLLQQMGAAGFNSTVDPTIAGILSTVDQSQKLSTGFLPITGQPYWQTMEWSQKSDTNQIFPTARLDYQINPAFAYTMTWNMRHENIQGSQPPYPGLDQYAFSNGYKINTYVLTNTLNWVISPDLLNSVSFGVQSNAEFFSAGSDPHQWAPYGNRILSLPLISATIPNVLPFIRNNPVYQVRDDVTWTRGNHNLTLGGLWKHTSFWERSYGSAGVPHYSIGLASGDPAAAAVQAALPGINAGNGDLANAEGLYALLTGRVSGISGNVNVDDQTHTYTEFQPETQRWAFTTASLYAQDAYRATSNLTLNYGLHWEFDQPIRTTNGIDSEPSAGAFFGPSTALFQPGALNGNPNPYYSAVSAPYRPDYFTPAPNFGFAWNPSVKHGPLAWLMGNHTFVVRGGYAVNFYNEGMNAISNVVTDNPGNTQSIFSNPGDPGFTLGGLNLSSPAPPLATFPGQFGFPIPESEFALAGGQFMGLVNPNLRTPYTQSWNLGIQRELPGRAVLEIAYIGNKSTHMWHAQNLDETNIFENGFLPQFEQAQANLNANVAAGKGSTFAYNGLPGQAATPIFDAAFGANGSFGAVSSRSGYANSTFVTDLQEGLAGSLASSLASTRSISPGYYCRLVGSNFAPCAAAGFTGAGAYPINFWQPNPFATGLEYQDDNGDNNYNALQVEVRKGFGHGLSYTANFVWSHSLGDQRDTNDQTATYQWFTQRDARLSYGPSGFDHRFTWNSFWTYDLPVGRGKYLNINNGWLDRALGGWTLGGTEQISTGAPVLLTSGRDTFNDRSSSGEVFAGGLTPAQLQADLNSVPNTSVNVNGDLVSNIAAIAQSNGIANPSFYAPASTPGSFGQIAYLRNVPSVSLNMSLNKSIPLAERLNLSLRAEALNFLNHPFFNMGSTSSTSNSFGLVSGASGTRTILIRAALNY
ncbi:MAG TPA: hypothetical protein VN515_06475, partial [Terriglobales bacterium]|nr:hypothetical protein [Terriglobales bacterium]